MKGLNEFCGFLSEIDDPKEMKRILRSLLTPSELEELPTRLQILKLLQKGVSQREIASKLGVGIATVTRGARVLKESDFPEL